MRIVVPYFSSFFLRPQTSRLHHMSFRPSGTQAPLNRSGRPRRAVQAAIPIIGGPVSSSASSASASEASSGDEEFQLVDAAVTSSSGGSEAEPDVDEYSLSAKRYARSRATSKSQRRKKKLKQAVETITSAAVDSTLVTFSPAEISSLRSRLLEWYVVHRRDLPWRAAPRYRSNGPCVHPTVPPESQFAPGAPYGVWVSEIMSQQTRLEVVVRYWNNWMKHFPTVEALAAAPMEKVNEVWAGLGYYRRARCLHEAAIQIVRDFDGQLPRSVEGLLKVKGIGKYTAGAICSVAFNIPAPAVDGNVERVLARMRPGIMPNKFPTNTPGAKAKVYEGLATTLVADIECAGDFNQALMELGATVCTPKRPRCEACPVQSLCGSYADALLANQDPCAYAQRFPVKDLSRRTKSREETVLVCVVRRCLKKNGDADVPLAEYLLLQRPNSGLLANMWEAPNIVLSASDAKKHSSVNARRRMVEEYLAKLLPQIRGKVGKCGRLSVGQVTHVFSHIRQELYVDILDVEVTGEVEAGVVDGAKFRWLSEADVGRAAVATQMRKAMKLAFDIGKPGKTRRVVRGIKRGKLSHEFER